MALVAALALAWLPQPSNSAEFDSSTPPGGQFRAFWVDAFGDDLFDAPRIDAIVASTKAARLNAIVVQAVRRGDCFCNRASVPRTEQPGVAAFPFDPLQTLIDKAHAQGIEVHAWVIATAFWRTGGAPATPASPAHAFNQHGPSATGYANWLMSRDDGQVQAAADWLVDPGHPDAAQWIVNTATSIVANYAVDGINLDRIRYPDGNSQVGQPTWGYNPVAIARFQQAYGRTDRPVASDPQWAQWRRDQITNIVRKVYIESFAIRPSVRVSADTITYGNGPQSQGGWTNSRAYKEMLQDWDGWMREGILDLNMPMNYKRDQTTPSDQRRMYQEWSDFAKDAAVRTPCRDRIRSLSERHRRHGAPGAHGRRAVQRRQPQRGLGRLLVPHARHDDGRRDPQRCRRPRGARARAHAGVRRTTRSRRRSSRAPRTFHR